MHAESIGKPHMRAVQSLGSSCAYQVIEELRAFVAIQRIVVTTHDHSYTRHINVYIYIYTHIYK